PGGESLAERLRGARGSLEEALLVGQQLAAALAALHEAGAVHGGFDPARATWLGHGAVKAHPLAAGPSQEAYRAPEVRAGAPAGSYGRGRSGRRRRGWGVSDRYRLPLLPINTGAVAFVIGVLVLWGFYTTATQLASGVFGGLRVVKTSRGQDEAPPPAPDNLG